MERRLGVQTRAQSPVSTLPDDILCKILTLVFELHRESVSLNLFFKDRGLLVTRVCRRWRSVALDYGPIWTHINAITYSSQQVEQYLARSKMCRLTVLVILSTEYISEPKTTDERSFIALRPHIWRVESFYICGMVLLRDLRQHLYRFLLDSAQNLRELTLVTGYDVMHANLSVKERAEMVLTEDITSNLLSLLSKLTLINIVPSVHLSWLNTISSLTLRNETVDINGLLRMLSRCSNTLERLSLINVSILMPVQEDGPIKFDIIDLPRLYDTNFAIAARSRAALLPFLRPPKDFTWLKSMFLTLKDDLDRLLEDAFDSYALTISPGYDLLVIELRPRTKSVSFQITDTSQELVDLGRRPHNITIQTENIIWLEAYKFFFKQLANIPPSGLSKLHFNFYNTDSSALADFTFDTEMLNALVTASPDIEVLQFSLVDGDMQAVDYVELQTQIMIFLSSLKLNMEEEGNWPQLQTLTLTGFNFGGAGKFWDIFVDFIRTSIRPGITLTVENAHFLDTDMEAKIRDIVDKFHVITTPIEV